MGERYPPPPTHSQRVGVGQSRGVGTHKGGTRTVRQRVRLPQGVGVGHGRGWGAFGISGAFVAGGNDEAFLVQQLLDKQPAGDGWLTDRFLLPFLYAYSIS